MSKLRVAVGVVSIAAVATFGVAACGGKKSGGGSGGGVQPQDHRDGDEAAAEAEQHRGNAGSKACQRNNNDLIQESIPDLKMSEQLIPVAYCFPFA